MRWLPYEIIILNIPQSPDVAAAQLSAVVEPKKYLRLGRKHTTFEGVVNNHSFKLQRIIDYRNSFLPQITGTLEAQSEGTLLKIKFALSPLIATFMTYWFGFTIFFEIAAICGLLVQGGSPFFLLIPLGFAAFGFMLMHICFWPEVANATELLKKVWKEKIPPPHNPV